MGPVSGQLLPAAEGVRDTMGFLSSAPECPRVASGAAGLLVVASPPLSPTAIFFFLSLHCAFRLPEVKEGTRKEGKVAQGKHIPGSMFGGVESIFRICAK